MTGIPLPRLLDGQLREIRRLRPLQVSIEQNLAPVSSATMALIPGECLDVRQFVELFTSQGSAGIFRIGAVEDSLIAEGSAELQHGLVTLQDALMPGQGEQTASARTLLTALLSHQKSDIRWTLGDVDVPEDTLLHWEWDHTNLLSGLCDLMEQLPAYRIETDQTALPWVMHVRALDDSSPCQCRVSRNLTGVSITRDDADLVTRLYVSALAEPIDADTIGVWGAVERTLDVDEELGEEAIRHEAERILSANKDPLLTVELEAVELSRLTGESVDRLTLGRMCQVCLADWDRVVDQRIVALTWPDVYAQPDLVTATLANRARDTADAIAGLVVDTEVLRRYAGENRRLLRLQAQRIELLGQEISLKADATVFEGLASRVSSAEVEIDGLNAQIVLKADVNAFDGLEKRVSSAEISIDGLNSQITLKADKIDLQGYVTAAELDAAVVSALESYSQEFYTTDLYASTANISAQLNTEFLVANTVETSALTLGGTSLGMTSRALVTGIYWPNFYITTKTIEYLNSMGQYESAEVVTGVHGVTSPTLQYETFYYVGGVSE